MNRPPRDREEAGVNEALPQLLDAKGLQAELGIGRAVAERLMRQLPVVTFPGIRKVYVVRADVERYVEGCTSEGEWRFKKTEMPA